MPKKGPGRSLKLRPGPKINPKSNIVGVPNREFEDTILKEVLNDAEFSFFTNLPRTVKDSYIGALKNSLFNIQGKADAAQALNFSVEEYQDLAGVQVNLSLNPADWRDPERYVSETVKRWYKSLINWDDIEREIEKEIALDLMKGGNGTKTLGNTRILDTLEIDPNDKRKDIEGATGIKGRVDYKEYATHLANFIDESMSIGSRGQALDSAKAKFYELLAKELYNNNPQAAVSWLDVKQSKDPVKVSAYNDAIGRGFNRVLNSLPNNADKARLVKFFQESTKDGGFLKDFQDSSILKIKGAPSYTLADIASGKYSTQLINGTANEHFSQDNYISRLKFLETLTGTFDPVFTKDIENFASLNWKSLGFSSKEAVAELFATTRVKNPGTTAKVAAFSLFSPSQDKNKLALVNPNIKYIKPQDLAVFRTYMDSINDKANDARKSLISAMDKNFKLHEDAYIKAIADTIPDAENRRLFIENTRAIRSWKDYVEIRNTQLSYEEFVGFVRDKKIMSKLLFNSKYNKYLPKRFQDIYKQVREIPLPLQKIGIRKLDDLTIAASGMKDFVAFKTGLASDITTYGYYTDVPLLNPFVRAFKNHTYLYQSDFTLNTEYAIDMNTYVKDGVLTDIVHTEKIKFDLFDGDTYANFKGKSTKFKNSGIFKNYDPGVLLLFADEFNSLPTVIEGVERMVDYLKVNNIPVSSVKTDFEIWFDMWKQTGNMDFFDTLAGRLAKGTAAVTPEEMGTFKSAFEAIFKKLNKLHEENDIATKDFFSLVCYISNDKGFLKRVVKNGTKEPYMLFRYMPFLNTVSSHLNQAQTYIIRFAENKFLRNTIFKYIPGTQDLWNVMVKPGIGSYDLVKTKIEPFLQDVFRKMRLDILFKRFVNSPVGAGIRAFLSRILPSTVTAAGFATLGTSFLMYAAARYGKATVNALLGILKGNFKAIYYEFLYATKDIFVVPVNFILKIILYILLAFVGILAFLLLLLVPATVRQERELSSSTTEYGQLVPIELRDGKYCISESFGGEGYEVLRGKIGFPVNGSTTYTKGQCPGLSKFYAYGKHPHMGVDISAVMDTDVRTPFTDDNQCWKLERFGWDEDGYGKYVLISAVIDGKPFSFYFAHNNSFNNELTVGQTYCEPKFLAKSDSTGNSEGPHVHFEIRSADGSFNNVVNPCSVIACPSDCFSDDFSKSCMEEDALPKP